MFKKSLLKRYIICSVVFYCRNNGNDPTDLSKMCHCKGIKKLHLNEICQSVYFNECKFDRFGG